METEEDDKLVGFGKMLREFREAKGLRQRALAELLGCTDGFIAYIENERRQPSDDFLLRFSQELTLSPTEKTALVEAVGRGRLAASTQRSKTKLATTRKLFGSEVDDSGDASVTAPTDNLADDDAEKLRQIVEKLRSNPALIGTILQMIPLIENK
jgi:transcriptional regulator with XRE-family HTH domain